MTEHLTIERAALGADAGLAGVGLFALQRALARALGDAGGTGTDPFRTGTPSRSG